MEHSAGQLPFLAMASHKSSENRHQKTNYNAVPNIIITNSTFNYRHNWLYLLNFSSFLYIISLYIFFI